MWHLHKLLYYITPTITFIYTYFYTLIYTCNNYFINMEIKIMQRE